MEIFKGPKDKQIKVYESEWIIEDLNHQFDNIKFSDAHLCNSDQNYPIEIMFISRNQFLMENKLVTSCKTSL